MTDNGGARVSSDESQTRQRKKRRWDQPAESFVAAAGGAGLIMPAALPLNTLGSLASVMVPGTSALTTALLASPMVASSSIVSPMIPVTSAAHQSSTINSRLNQVKIQEDLLIAREIVINDAEPSLRYRLTKRQTQEEILNRTGAVVITRGKYRPPNTPSDEKPLYLHISAAAHLKETAERIIAVDRAAAMIEDMMKQGPNFQFPLPSVLMTNGVQAGQSLSVCIYLGFDVDPSWNIAARIRGPNDLYISHIMNETGATVSLKGRGSGALEGPHGEGEQPLHLFLSSNNKKSLDDAKRLAENLLDTISAEYGASRISSAKVYGAVPPPPQLLPATEVACKPSMNVASAVSSSVGPIIAPAVSSSGLPNIGNYMQPPLTGGTSYRGYEGLYPQATPLQQVALALKQSPSITSSLVPTATTSVSEAAKSITSSVPEKEKKPPQRRKFQELPAGLSVSTRLSQGMESINSDTSARDLETVPPKRLVASSSDGLSTPPPPPFYKSMPPPPPPPKFTSGKPSAERTSNKVHILKETKPDPVPDTLLKLVEYGEEDDDPDEAVEDSSTRKPFWAV